MLRCSDHCLSVFAVRIERSRTLSDISAGDMPFLPSQSPSRLRSYVVNKSNYPIRLKGRAWIRADNPQIIHLETDLVRSIPEIHLMTEHTNVSYGPVQFRKSGTDLWLPKSAELYVHFGKRRFYRSESFDHFMLFATDAVEKAKLPNIFSSQSPAANTGSGLLR